METLRKIVEDALLTAANIRTGEDLDEGLGSRDYRAAELVVNIAERIVAAAGIDPATVWVPSDVFDMTDLGMTEG